jgi:hypothetical protein
MRKSEIIPNGIIRSDGAIFAIDFSHHICGSRRYDSSAQL